MMDISDAVTRYLKHAINARYGKGAEKHGEGLFLPVPRKGEIVEIRGSMLRYVSMPGQFPADEASVEAVARGKHWNRMRRKVATNARIK